MNNRIRLILGSILVFAILLSFPIASAQEEVDQRTGLRPDAPPYGVRGPHPVGTMTMTLEDAERPLTVWIWYPALNPEGLEEQFVYSIGVAEFAPPFDAVNGQAIFDATPDTEGNPYPLVIFSHGLFGSSLMSVPLLEHLASHGFVVVAPEHMGTHMLDFFTQSEETSATDVIEAIYYRPADLVHMMELSDTLTGPGGALEGAIDTDTAAVMGYSTGGTSAFQVAGSRLDFSYLGDWCAEQGEEWYAHEACQFLGQQTMLAPMFNVPGETEGLWPAMVEPRLDALVTIAPGGELPAFGTESLSEVSLPTLILLGSNDPVVSPEHNAFVAFEHVGSPQKSLVVFDGGGHVMFTKCTDETATVAFMFCSDAVWDIDRVLDVTNHFTTAFLLSVLYEDADAAAALSSASVSFPGITYETTGF